MTYAELPKTFRGLTTATFETSYDVADEIGATLIDTLSYSTFTKKDSIATAPKESASAVPSAHGEAPVESHSGKEDSHTSRL